MSSHLFSRKQLLQLLLIGACIVVSHPGASMAQGIDHLNAGLEAAKRGDLDIAIERYTMAIRSNDLSRENLAVAYGSRGFARFSLGQYLAAQSDFKKRLDLEPTYRTRQYGFTWPAPG